MENIYCEYFLIFLTNFNNKQKCPVLLDTGSIGTYVWYNLIYILCIGAILKTWAEQKKWWHDLIECRVGVVISSTTGGGGEHEGQSRGAAGTRKSWQSLQLII